MRGNSSSLVRAIRGPVTLITVGVLFALNNFTPYSFNQTWPVLLIVFGLLSLLRRGTEAADVPPPGYGYQRPGGPYNQPPAGSYNPSTGAFVPSAGAPSAGVYNPPPRGGFGAAAPPRTAPEPGSDAPPPATGGAA